MALLIPRAICGCPRYSSRRGNSCSYSVSTVVRVVVTIVVGVVVCVVVAATYVIAIDVVSTVIGCAAVRAITSAAVDLSHSSIAHLYAAHVSHLFHLVRTRMVAVSVAVSHQV